jgi:4-amino-4-deoxy-L-arabinose transferase-like glycosyltransferase
MLPALLINLGLLPLIGDESIRALVSLEMILSGDYITPTLNGVPYFNKPPLYNWILAGFFKVFNRNNELMTRLPTILFLLIYCYTIFYWIKKELGTQIGLLASLMFLTCGRILFWDSFLGLIDIAFSWLVFMNFMIIWHYFRRGNYTILFLLSYVLAAFSFLLKGLPSLAFQGITLLVIFISHRKQRYLVSWKHFMGIGVFLFITGAYYLLYYFRNQELIKDIFYRLIAESTQKSAIGAGVIKTLLHLIAFPLEVFYHFLPWTLLVVFIFPGKIFRKAFGNPFIRYCLLVFLFNILIYWASPITYPRYLLMLVPLLFIVVLYFGRMHSILNTSLYRFMKGLILITLIFLLVSGTLLPIIFAGKLPVTNLYAKSFFILAIGILVLYPLYFTRKATLLYSLGLILLVTRISFNVFLLPYRQGESWATKCRSDAIEVAEFTKNHQLFCLTDTITIPTSYYLTRERQEILHFAKYPEPGPYYIVSDTTKYGNNFAKEYAMRIPHPSDWYYIGRFYTKEP